MSNFKRKRFFIKGNFQITFIFCFISLLFIEVVSTAFIIHGLSYSALEEAIFKSHLNIDTASQIISPIIIKVNICVILASIALSCVAVTIAYFRLCALFGKIIDGLRHLKNNTLSFRIAPSGGKNTRELIAEFNHAASFLDKRLLDLRALLDSLIAENELKDIAQLHNRLQTFLCDK